LTQFVTALGLIYVAVLLYVLYDLLVNQDEMVLVEKLVWAVVALWLNWIGVLFYLYVVKDRGRHLLDEQFGGGRYVKLDRLRDLHEDGVLTDEEFEQEKERVLGDD
ncbi:MAG: SHOCT domain-containing protein, partial [Candidatus Nanohaloarchaea archaeon]